LKDSVKAGVRMDRGQFCLLARFLFGGERPDSVRCSV
jgi:hypothetical protein